MNKSRRNLCRHVGLALCLLMIFTVLPVPVAASETKTDTESKTVRVGWYPDSYHITGEMVNEADMVMNTNRQLPPIQAGITNI